MGEPKTETETRTKLEEAPTMVIQTPLNYEQTHELVQCPLCNKPNPVLDMHIPVREFRYFDINLYVCDTLCECDWNPDPIKYDVSGLEIKKSHSHKFSAKHEFLKDVEHLKIYDRTHIKDVW